MIRLASPIGVIVLAVSEDKAAELRAKGYRDIEVPKPKPARRSRKTEGG